MRPRIRPSNTFRLYLKDVLFETCLRGLLPHMPRRLPVCERVSMIRSGCVFIYDETASGIERWTDGLDLES